MPRTGRLRPPRRHRKPVTVVSADTSASPRRRTDRRIFAALRARASGPRRAQISWFGAAWRRQAMGHLADPWPLAPFTAVTSLG
jgi:hypothetical protein